MKTHPKEMHNGGKQSETHISYGPDYCTGAVLGVAATALLITGIAIEYNIYSKPGWPFKKPE